MTEWGGRIEVGRPPHVPACGLCAARFGAILSKIGAGYANHEITAERVGRDLGLSTRYVHAQLMETGMSFSERVMELRLQRTFELLSDRRNQDMQIGKIALGVGFGDISNFNRAFRRRFGSTLSAVR